MNCSVTFNSSSCFNLATSVTKTFFPFGGGGVCVCMWVGWGRELGQIFLEFNNWVEILHCYFRTNYD